MDTVTVALLLLVAVVISSVLARMLPAALPRPLIEIAVGGMLGLITDLHVELDPQLFFLLFLPPLLFLSGWRIPHEETLQGGFAILQLALGLVFTTVFCIGVLVHWLLPAMPIAVAFALAAVISPTDPVAVSSILVRTPLPRRTMRLIEGESLLNDASGLVCLRFAVAAAVTGTFSIQQATLTFAWLAAGGIGVGVGLTWAITRLKIWVSEQFGEETGSQILISVLIPFAAYMGAERLGCSGILAAVAAGVTMSIVEAEGRALPSTRLQRSSVWNAIQFTANGVIFVILGEQLPGILRRAEATARTAAHLDQLWLAAYVLLISGVLLALRFLWIAAALYATWFRRRAQAHIATRPKLRLVGAATFAGVRGAITLAGVLTLPLDLRGGAPFPARDLAIVLAMGVIITSLVIASVALPLLLKGLEVPAEPLGRSEEAEARIAAAQAAIAAVDGFQNGGLRAPDAAVYEAPAARLVASYRARIQATAATGPAAELLSRNIALERELQAVARSAERSAILRLLHRRRIGMEVARKLYRELDLAESREA